MILNHTDDLNQNEQRPKIVKRYQNRKLYDTQQSCYVTLDDIAKMVRSNEHVVVIDNKSKNDITAATLTQIIFEAEKKSAQYAPLGTLREIIQHKNSSISAFLAKLGAFPMEEYENQKPQRVDLPTNSGGSKKGDLPFEEVRQTLEKRVASAAMSMGQAENLVGGETQPYIEILPNLPNPNNKNFEPQD